jgi:hypothetical protein
MQTMTEKFMQSLADPMFKKVRRMANQKGISLQDEIRLAVSDHIQRQKADKREAAKKKPTNHAVR